MMAGKRKTSPKGGPTAPFAIGESVMLVSGGPAMTVAGVTRTCGGSFFVSVVFFGQSEQSAAQMPVEKALVERMFDSRMLTHDSDIPF